MSVTLDVLEFALQDYSSVESCTRAFDALAAQMGYSLLGCGRLTADPARYGRGSIWYSSSHPWAKHWNQHRYKDRDPAIWYLRERQAPIRWSAMQQLDGCPARERFEEVRQFRLADGIVIGLAFSPKDIVSVSLGTEMIKKEDEREDALIQFAALYCGAQLRRLCKDTVSKAPNLSKRETECLRWVASGKTDWDISNILGISEYTAQEHIKSTLRKLNASSRAQAVAIALVSRQITL